MMARNLDLAALRAVLVVTEAGSVTRAAALLNLTQSAVSMQIRRLEEALGVALFNRRARRLEPTVEGQCLVTYARRMLALNDEALEALGLTEEIEEIRLGVPPDIVAPQIPAILRMMAVQAPRLRITLTTHASRELRVRHEAGDLDLILTTETAAGPGGEVLDERRLTWIGAPGLRAEHERPLRIAFAEVCAFRPIAIAALDAAGIAWRNAMEGDSESVVDATVAAGLGVSVRLEGYQSHGCLQLGPDAGLPDLGRSCICFYDGGRAKGAIADALRAEIRRAYCAPAASAAA